MEKMICEIKKFIELNNLILENEVVGCALSGGADSIFMTFLLNKLSSIMKFKLLAIHVNHMLRGYESENDQKFVEDFCVEYNIPLKVYKVDVKEYSIKNKLSLEMAGREVRYNIFEELKNKNIINKCAIAHHIDDDVETIIMRLFKGTGLKGIEGIKVIRENFYIRPVLFLKRIEHIEKFLHDNKIQYITDKSNLTEDYLRNKIRLSIIPMLNQSFNMDIRNNILNLKEICKLDNEYFNKIISDNMEKYVKKSNESIYINKQCFKLDKAILYRIIRESINIFNGEIVNFNLKHIKYICEIVNKKVGSVIQIKKNLFCLNDHEYIRFLKSIDSNEGHKSVNIELLNKIEIRELKEEKKEVIKCIKFFNKNIKISFNIIENYNMDFNNTKYKYFSLDEVFDSIIIRNRKNGDIFMPYGMNTYKKLKDIFINEKFSNRDEIPLICFDSNIVWVYKYRNSQKHKVLENSKYIVKIKLEYV